MKNRILNVIQDLRIELSMLNEYTTKYCSDIEKLRSALDEAYDSFQSIDVDFVKDMPDVVFLMLGPDVINEEYFAELPDEVEMEMVDIKGILTIKDKIWFNDVGRCRLRICGFEDGDIKRLEDAVFVDISIVDTDDEYNIKGKLHISTTEEYGTIFDHSCKSS